MYINGVCLLKPNHADPMNVVIGAFKRLAVKTPEMSPEVLEDILLFMDEQILPQFPQLDPDQIPTTNEWLNNAPYPKWRKIQISDAYDELAKSGFSVWADGCSDLKSFIKDEFYTELKAPRWINARVDAFKAAFGPYVQACTDVLAKHPCLIKKIPVKDRAAYISEVMGEHPFYAAADVTSYEAHFVKLRKRIEHKLLLWILGRAFNEVRLSQIINRLLVQTRMSMRNFGFLLLECIRASGEMDTSFSNTVSTYVMVSYLTILKKNKLSFYSQSSTRGIITVPDLVHCVAEGDDSAAPYDKFEDIPTIEDWRRVGFNCKVLTYTDIGKMSFCGQVFDPADMTIVTDPLEVLAKFGWTPRRYSKHSPKFLKSLLKSKILSLAHEYGRNPILWALARRGMQLYGHVNVRRSIIDGMSVYERERYLLNVEGDEPMINPPGLQTRFLVQELYGISIETQIAVENRILTSGNIIDLSGLIDFPPLWVTAFDIYTSDTPEFEATSELSSAHISKILDAVISIPEKPKVLIGLIDQLSRAHRRDANF